jgi:transposase InsO family protein
MITAPWKILDGCNSQESSRKVKNEVFCRFGSPKNIVSDNRSHFVNNSLRQLCKEWSIRHVLLSAYHPCRNKLERTNADLVRMAASYMRDCNGNWDVHVHKFTLVLCSMIGNTTQVSLVFINLRREIQLLIDRCLNRRMPRLVTSSSFVSQVKSIPFALKELIKKVRNIFRKSIKFTLILNVVNQF